MKCQQQQQQQKTKHSNEFNILIYLQNDIAYVKPTTE